MNRVVLSIVCLALAGGTAAAVRPVAAGPDVRVGTYDSRAIAIAFAASSFNPVAEKMKEMEAAKKAGDKTRMAELEAWGQSHQRRLHRQGFSRVPVDDCLAPVKAGLAEVARSQKLDLIAASYDHAGERVEVVDVTDALVALFQPSSRTLTSVAEIRKVAPVDLDEIGNDH
jgi:hypothetical protein